MTAPSRIPRLAVILTIHFIGIAQLASAQVLYESGRVTLRNTQFAAYQGEDDRDAPDFVVDPAIGEFPVTNALISSATASSFMADGASEISVSLSETETGLTGMASGMAMASMSHPGPDEVDDFASITSRATSVFRFIVDVTEAPAMVSASGTVTGSGMARASGEYSSAFVITDLANNERIEHFNGFAPPLPDEGLNEMETISISRMLAPGRYEFEAIATASPAVSLEFGPQSGQSTFSVSFTITGTDGGGGSQVDDVFWDSGSGAFSDETNWDPEEVPNTMQTAIFDRDATYTVTLGTESAGKAYVERGSVTFMDGSLDLQQGGADDPSLVVGRDSSDAADVTLQMHTLTPGHAAIGQGSNSDGAVTVEDASDLNVDGRLTIGDAGMGALTIEDGGSATASETQIGVTGMGQGTVSVESAPSFASTNPEVPATASWQPGATAIGLQGTGEVEVGAARVASGAVVLGVMNGASGSIEITGGDWDFDEDTIIGDGGMGMLTVSGAGGSFAGELTETLTLADDSDSLATVLVSDGALFGSLGAVRIGNGGEASLTVEGGASATSGFLTIGSSAGSEGTLIVRGMDADDTPSRVTALQDSFIAFSGDATVRVEDGALLDTAGVSLGNQDEAHASVTIDSATWMNTGSFFLGSASFGTGEIFGTSSLVLDLGLLESTSVTLAVGSSLTGVGEVRANVMNEGGLISGGIAVTGKQDSSPGVLTIDGDLNSVDGELEAVAGPGGGSTIAVTGDATIEGGTLRWIFVDGYLPTMGDTLPFLTADGTLSLADTTLEYAGAAEGFLFETEIEDGVVMFRAQNDAQPMGGEGEGEGEGEGVGCAAATSDVTPGGWGTAILLIGVSLVLISRRRRSLRGDS